MSDAAPRPGGPNKFSRYRETRKAEGLKLLRLWTPDPRAAAFKIEMERQMKALRGAPEELESLDFIAAVGDWPADEA